MRGMRKPLESWDKASKETDIDLAQRLIKAGPEHRKFMRQIYVSVDITAPIFWWKEFDTYKIGTTANSTSTMHKLTAHPITIDCFEMDEFEDDEDIEFLVASLENLRLKYLETKERKYWKKLVCVLPQAWLQTRTVTMTYENIYNMIRQRENHKLTEWHDFIEWAKKLPQAEEFLFL